MSEEYDVFVNHAGATQSAADLRAGVLTMHQQLDDLKSEIGKLRGGLSADTLQRYDTRQLAFDTAFTDLCGRMTELANAVQAVADNTVSTDRQIANIFNA